MDQFFSLFTEYAGVIGTALSAGTIAAAGIILHRLKKIERRICRVQKEMECRQQQESIPESEPAVSAAGQPAASRISEQEKLLDAVLDEVFP